MKHTITSLISLLLVLTICLSCLPLEAIAWGKMTHVYTANLMEDEAVDGYVTLQYGVDSEDVEELQYSIPQEYLEAIRAYPDMFRAGSLGPDVYPDIITGQMYIHPEDKNIDSGEWVIYLCNAVNKMAKDTEGRKMALSFTMGCMLHFCGDLFGHDFVNTFSGGAFPSLMSSDIIDLKGARLNNILSHMSVEKYMDELLYPSYDADKDGGIDAPDEFVSNVMVFNGAASTGLAAPYAKYPQLFALSDIESDFLRGLLEDFFSEEGNNVPPQYTAMLALRKYVTSTADEYREHMEPVSACITAYCDAWAEDIDDGIMAFTEACDSMARRMVTGEKNPSIEAAKLKDRAEGRVFFKTKDFYKALDDLMNGKKIDKDMKREIEESGILNLESDAFFDLILDEMVDEGLITKEFANNKDNGSLMIIKEELGFWWDEYGVYMLGIPDILIDGIEIPFIGDFLDLLMLGPLWTWIKDEIKSLIAEYVVSAATGMVANWTGLTEEQATQAVVDFISKIDDRLDKPQVQLDHKDNPYKPSENNFAELEEYMKTLPREKQYSILDSEFEAVYNTLTMFQLVLMGPENYSEFIHSHTYVKQTSYHKNTAYPEVTSLKVSIKTSDLFWGGTNDNIYAVVYRVNSDGSKTLIKRKLMDISFHDDFEQGDTQTYMVELPESVRLDQMEFAFRKTPCFDFVPGITDDWHCENIRVTPIYAGYEQTAPIDMGGVKLKGICQSVGMNFQLALNGGEALDHSNKQYVTNLKVEVKVKDELYAGSDSDIYLQGYWGSNCWQSVVLDKGRGHNDLERGKTEIYNIPITNYSSGTARGVPLNELYVAFKNDGIDEANWQEVKIIPCYGSVELTEPLSLGGKKFEDETWQTSFQNRVKGATYRPKTPDLSQTASELKVQVTVADELWAGTDSNIYLNIYSGDSEKPAQRVLLDKNGYNDFEQGDNDIYSVSLSGSAAKIPVNQMRLEFEHTGTDEANWAEVQVTPYKSGKALTDAISLGGQKFQCIFWDTDFQSRLKLRYAPITTKYETNLDSGLLSYMDSLDGGEEWVDEDNELWANADLRTGIFLKIFKGFSPEIEYTGDSKVEENGLYTFAVDVTGVWNGVSMDRRSQVKDFQHTPPVEGWVLVEFRNEKGEYVYTTSADIKNNKGKWSEITHLEPGYYDLLVTYKPSIGAQYATSEPVVIPRALQVTATKYEVMLKTDGTPGCTVSGGGTVQDGDSITITASTGPVYYGYKFKEWRMGNSVIGTDATMTFTPPYHCTLTACFEPEICTVAINGGVSTVQAKLGTQAKLTAKASDAFKDPSYKYYIMYPGRTTWEVLANSKNGTITIPATANCDGARVKVEATDSIGRKATNEVKLVIAEPVAIKTQPKNVTTNIGGKATFKVEAQYGRAPYTYKWQFRDSSTSDWIDVDAGWGTGYNSASFTVTAELSRICKGNEYRCIVTDATGAYVVSNAASITSNEFAVQLENGASKIVYDAHSGYADPRNVIANVAGGTAPVTFTWYKKNTSTGQWVKISTDAAFALEASMAYDFYLKVEAKDANGKVATSNEVYVEIRNTIVN